MRVPTDLHPEDLQIRLALTRTLRRARDVDQITARTIADRVGVTPPAVRAVEHGSNWEARTIMRYARGVGWRIEWLLDDLPAPDDGDVMAIVIAALDTSTPERVDAVHWRTLWNTLLRVRRDRITAVEMACRLGVTENAVHWVETNTDGTAVITAQRHARALDGRLTWRLHPIGRGARIGRPISYDQVAV
jgi:DNA-binding XRE family transcriptional regulator